MSPRVPTMLVAATTVLALASAFAVHPAAAQGTSSLSGTVCEAVQIYYIQAPEDGADKGCGQGLAGATVTLKPAGALGSLPATAKSATADKDGRYEVAGLADGEYAAEVTRTGFETATATVQVEGATAKEWLLTGKQVTLAGTVLGPSGEPVKDALVNACCTDKATEARTDAAGKYKLEVQAGHRDIYVRDAPGYGEASQRALVDGSAPVDFELEKLPAPDAAVAGTVRGTDGKPLAGIRVDLHGYGGPYASDTPPEASTAPDDPAMGMTKPAYVRGSHNWTTTDAAGRYRIGAYGGQEASIQVSQEGYVGYQQSLTLPKGETVAHDITLKKYPAKDAKLAGMVVDADTGEPVANVAIYTQNRPYGQTDWSDCGYDMAVADDTVAAESGSAGGGSAGSASMPYQPPACAIKVGADGTFEATLMPGATSVSVNHQPWMEPACLESRSSSKMGVAEEACSSRYYAWVGMVVLVAREQVELEVRLVPRPEPDAIVQGYVLDAESGKAIANATLWFSNQDAYGYGTATTDADGSYRISLRQGYHTFGVHAAGHHAWDGVVMAGAGTTDLDVRVQAGEDAYGWCCGYPMPLMEGKSTAAAPGMASTTTAAAGGDANDAGGQDAVAYKDLGGNLGPYDPQKRANVQTGGVTDTSQDSPMVALWLMAALLLGIAARRRK